MKIAIIGIINNAVDENIPIKELIRIKTAMIVKGNVDLSISVTLK